MISLAQEILGKIKTLKRDGIVKLVPCGVIDRPQACARASIKEIAEQIIRHELSV
jgi:hypothetical protein